MNEEEKDLLTKQLIAIGEQFGIKLQKVIPNQTKNVLVGKYNYWQYKGYWKIIIPKTKEEPRKILYLGKQNPTFDPKKDITNAKNHKKSPG